MPSTLEKEIYELGLRMRLVRAAQELAPDPARVSLNEREILILELINNCGKASISEIRGFFPGSASGTISTDISTLWKEKGLVDKSIDPENERSRQVQLTEKGRRVLEQIKKHQADRLSLLMKAIDVKEDERRVMEEVLGRAIDFIDQKLKDNISRPGGE